MKLKNALASLCVVLLAAGTCFAQTDGGDNGGGLRNEDSLNEKDWPGTNPGDRPLPSDGSTGGGTGGAGDLQQGTTAQPCIPQGTTTQLQQGATGQAPR